MRLFVSVLLLVVVLVLDESHASPDNDVKKHSQPKNSCGKCTARQLTLAPPSSISIPQLSNVILSSATKNAQGCVQISATCTATNAALLQLNDRMSPAFCVTQPVQTCMVTLVCDSNGQFTYTENGVTSEITSLECQAF